MRRDYRDDRSGRGERGDRNRDFQNENRDRSYHRQEHSPHEDYARTDYPRHNYDSPRRYSDTDAFRGQGRDLSYDSYGRGYGDVYRNPGDFEDRSYRYGSDRYEEGPRDDRYRDDHGYNRDLQTGHSDMNRPNYRDSRWQEERTNRPVRGQRRDWRDDDRDRDARDFSDEGIREDRHFRDRYY